MSFNVLVVGPESSGTRMLTQAFLSVGLHGDPGHEQRGDDLDFSAYPPGRFVFRRSIPHGGNWQNLGDILERMRKARGSVRAVAIFRDRAITAYSQMIAGHVVTLEQGLRRYDRAAERIFFQLDACAPQYVSYEMFIAIPAYREHVFGRLQLPAPQMTFFNGNHKYLRHKADLPALPERVL